MNRTVAALLAAIFVGSCVGAPLTPVDESFRDVTLPVKARVAALLSSMTLEEKLGQMTLVDRGFLTDDADISRYGLGGLLSGGGSAPGANTPEAWADMYDAFQREALESRLGIPLMYGVDAVHGHNNVRGAVIFPHNVGLGATRNEALVEEIARITAIEVAGTGIDWNFAPCIAVPRDERWGRTYEGFGEDPDLVAALGAAAVRGYQGNDLADPATILATPKHYVADGGTAEGDDQGDARITEEELRNVHLSPYVAAIDSGAASVMASFSSWNGVKVHGDAYLLTDVLRGELGFDGFVVSDWAAVQQLPGSFREQVALAVNAGIDMVMVPEDYRSFIDAIEAGVRSGMIGLERIDEAVRAILTVKFRLGLFERPFTDRSFTDFIGSDAHREVARRAVRESLVLLKNDGDVLPLSRDMASILVAGKNADNLGGQCGGWTISWQGQRGNDFTDGTTILAGIEQAVGDSVEVVFSVGGREAGVESGIAIVVIGESPYAEYQGDRRELALQRSDIELVQELKERGKTVITVLVSGRPMIIDEVFEASDALIAAWLPGTEGGGVADVLFGDFAPTGTLPHTWPRTMDQIPINVGDASPGDPLFPYGYGLGYR